MMKRRIKANGEYLSSSFQRDQTTRMASLSSKRTLQQLHRAAATETLREIAPLFSFKKPGKPTLPSSGQKHSEGTSTIPAASREQAARLYRGPTITAAGTWDAPHDSPGPQAYNEADTWRLKFRNEPSTRISRAKCERDAALPRTPGPGDYEVARLAVEERGKAVKIGDPGHRDRYPPRTPDQKRAEVPCSYAEHVSCLQHQVTSNRVNAPAFCFSGVPRFQNPRERPVNNTREASTSPLRAAEKHARSSPTQHPDDPAQNLETTNLTSSTKLRGNNKRRQRKRTRARGGPKIFRRGNYDYLRASVEPKPWQPTLRLTDDRNNNDNRRWPSTSRTTDGSSTCSLLQKEAARAVLRRGPRYNPAEYNPQNCDLPRESDEFPGPKYGRTPGAFGRTGAGGGVVSPSATLSALKRFPRGLLFDEEEIAERESTPGPESYDIALSHRLEGAALEKIRSSLQVLSSWQETLGVAEAGSWPFATDSHRSGVSGEMYADKENMDARSAASGERTRRNGGGRAIGIGSHVGQPNAEGGDSTLGACSGDRENPVAAPIVNDDHHVGAHAERGLHNHRDYVPSKKQRGQRDRAVTQHAPCSAGGTGSDHGESWVVLLPFGSATPTPTTSPLGQNHLPSGHKMKCVPCCSRLSPPLSSAAFWFNDGQNMPCRDCLEAAARGAASSYVAAACSLSDPNLHRRAKSTGASVNFGDMPRMRSAPAFSIGEGERGVAARLLHTPGEIIYREHRLGRSGLGPSTASPRAGDRVTRPRSQAARVIPPVQDSTSLSNHAKPRKFQGKQSVAAVTAFDSDAARTRDGEGGQTRGRRSGGVEGVGQGAGEGDVFVVDGALGCQVRSSRPTSPSFTMAGPRLARDLFCERLRYTGKALPPSEQYPNRPFFDAHIPGTNCSRGRAEDG